jgi:hypothetical protein
VPTVGFKGVRIGIEVAVAEEAIQIYPVATTAIYVEAASVVCQIIPKEVVVFRTDDVHSLIPIGASVVPNGIVH